MMWCSVVWCGIVWCGMVLYDGREEYRVIDIKGVQYDVQVSVQIVKFVKLIHTFVVSVLCQNIDTHTFIHTHTHTHTHIQ